MQDALVSVVLEQFSLVLHRLGHQPIEVSILVTARLPLQDLHPALSLRKSRLGVLGRPVLTLGDVIMVKAT
jgi:hypothetical protein